MENTFKSVEKESLQDSQQKLANGRELSAFVRNNIGIHYAQYTEKMIRNKDSLDMAINEMLSTGRGIILLGDVGVGKTTDLVYIIERIAEVQKKVRIIEDYTESVIYSSVQIPVSYYFMPDLFNSLHNAERVQLERYVMFDDWGREYAEPFALSRFEMLIEQLYAGERSIVITSNLTKEEFVNRPGWARITDRVREMCSVLEIQGQSMRHR
ncbi:MAG: hypothetical protein ACP5QX_07265 [Caldisericaceae bacterium]